MRRRYAWRIVLPAIAPVCLVLAQESPARESAPVGVVRGELLAWSGNSGGGELVFRNADNKVYQCSFDQHTYFERSNERITIAATAKGDRVEVLSDRKEGTGICYARTVEIVDAQQPRMTPGQRPRLRTSRSATDFFAPRGDMTFAGVVLKISPEALLVRTRANERKTILLRPDTRYLSEGRTLELSNLPVSTRVFIRAGKNYEDQVEAYQVVWGDILQPILVPRSY